jgi:PKD domain
VRRTVRDEGAIRSGLQARSLVFAIVCLLGCLVPDHVVARQRRPCAPSSDVPLPDLVQPYRGSSPGLYPGGRSTPEAGYATAGLEQAARIEPLDRAGKPSPGGQIVLLSIGMSNTASEFERFIVEARQSLAANQRLGIVNGALSSADASTWADPASAAWQHVNSVLQGNYAADQVQAIWMKQVHLKTAPFPEEVELFAADLESTVRIAATRFPNLRLVYVSSRSRAGADTRRGPGEPQAYETAFGVRRLIERQQNGSPGTRGPWVAWGPYLWANAVPRSDGLSWVCADLEPDLIHPSESGSLKVARQLMAFFMTDPTAAPWFLETRQRRMESAPLEIEASVSDGPAPLIVSLGTNPSRREAHYWSFGDGTSSWEASPRKTFHRAGNYEVRLTTTDSAGRWIRSSRTIRVRDGR